MPKAARWFASLPVAFTLLSAGCHARMMVDPALTAKAPEQPVSGVAFATFRKPVTFGVYTAKVTKGGFQTTSRTSLGPYERETKKQAFEYSLAGGAPASWANSCAYGSSKQGALFAISNDAGLVCTMVPEGAGGWQLELKSAGKLYGPNSLSGSMTDGTTTLSIKMVHQLQGRSFASAEPVGYEIRDAGGAAVAAVQIFAPHHVWIDPGLPVELQTAIAAAAAGLLVSAQSTSDLNDRQPKTSLR
ncbi:hypothetical protein [Nannocystis punicea]|uniref:Lipoprotein n=1 Tax=Nannocystis punicea TaxID=2995304 RepID=A0ABY7HGX7_9BACT|nr:hypothetical protein [Nannocystis poenicansa]WAS98358.1 hypothetical protein O0S08_19630 [Nannocystis poenicansa]